MERRPVARHDNAGGPVDPKPRSSHSTFEAQRGDLIIRPNWFGANFLSLAQNMVLSLDLASKLAAYFAEHHEHEVFVKFLSLSTSYRQLRVPRHPYFWTAFLAPEWVVVVVRKRCMNGTMPRCKIDELMEFFRHTAYTLPQELVLLRFQVIGSVVPLFRIMYPDYPFLEERRNDTDVIEALKLMRGNDIHAARAFVSTYRVPARRVICRIVHSDHLCGRLQLSHTDRTSIKMFVAAYTPLKKNDIPQDVHNYLFANRSQSQSPLRNMDSTAVAALVSAFPFDLPQKNQKFKMHVLFLFLDWESRDLLICLKQSTSFSSQDLEEALNKLELFKRDVYTVRKFVDLLLDVDFCRIPVGPILVPSHRLKYGFLWKLIRNDPDKFLFEENHLLKFLSFFVHDKADSVNFTTITDAVVAGRMPLSEAMLVTVKGTPFENLLHEIRHVVDQKIALTDEAAEQMFSTLEHTKAEIDALKESYNLICRQKTILESKLTEKCVLRDNLSTQVREARIVLSTPYDILVEDVLKVYLRSFPTQRQRSSRAEVAGIKTHGEPFMGLDEVMAAQHLLNLHHARQATAGGP